MKSQTPNGHEDAVLILEDGRAFRGQAFGAIGVTVGEAVFSTGMSGYQETLTDPSYRRQVVVMTAPHIGNTGMNDEDEESRRIWVAGFVVRDPARRSSNWRAQRTLDDDLVSQEIVGISGIDTRALTRHLRERGAMRVGIFSGPDARRPEAQLLAEVLASAGMVGANLTAEVSTPQEYVVEPVGAHLATVLAVDLGIKSMTPRRMAERGMRVQVLPAGISPDELLARARGCAGPVGVFFSNGPGDPAAAEHAVAQAKAILGAGLPVFGICFGHQVLGRALGFGTYKLAYGHRGINQPVADLASGRVEITAHNHGFAVDAPIGKVSESEFGRVEVSHVCLNDDVVEGLRCLDVPAFSVQYHPEAAAGPHDSAHLFDRFLALMGVPMHSESEAGNAPTH